MNCIREYEYRWLLSNSRQTEPVQLIYTVAYFTPQRYRKTYGVKGALYKCLQKHLLINNAFRHLISCGQAFQFPALANPWILKQQAATSHKHIFLYCMHLINMHIFPCVLHASHKHIFLYCMHYQ